MDDADVIVAGGGLAGLVAARRLAERGAEVSLFERESTVGGRVRSRQADGYTFDRGFQVLFTAYPAVRRELDLDALDLRAFRPGAIIARDGTRSVLADPFGDPEAILESAFNREVTLGDKLRTLKLRRALAGRDLDRTFERGDVSTREYLADRGFSERFVEHFAAPFFGGITLDRDLGTSSHVFEYTFGALARGRIAVPAAGMGAITQQLASAARDAGVEIETDTAVEGVVGVKASASVEAGASAVPSAGAEAAADDSDARPAVDLGGETVDADAVVVATDPATAGDLTGVATPTAAKGCVTAWFVAPDGFDLGTDRRIVLNAGSARPNHVVHHTEVAPEYAPEGADVVSATFLGTQDASDDELAATARDAIASWYPERRVDGLQFHHADRIAFAQFAQPPGFRNSLPEPRAPGGSVYLAGDYTRWSSIQGALESGRRAARAVAADW
jgi:phytoene dehydrogenase-like protein